MHRLLIIGLLLFFFFKTAPAQNPNVFITGKLQMDAEYRTIYVENYDRRPKILDSAVIDQGGQFSLEFQVKVLNFYKLILDPENFLVLIISPQEKIKITSLASAIASDPVIEGSPHSSILQALILQVRPYDRKMDSLQQEAIRLKATDSANVEGLTLLNDRYVQTDVMRKEGIRAFFESNPSSPACLFYSNRLPLTEYLDTFILLDDSLYSRYPANPYVRELHYAVTAQRYIQPGLVAPEISAPTPDGDTASLGDLKGNIVLIDFWAAWCGPCRKENPNVVAMYRKYHDAGFEVFGVSLDENRENWVKAIAADSLTWIHVSELKKWESTAAMAYAVRAIPFSVLLDREGRIIARELRGSALRNKLEEIFLY